MHQLHQSAHIQIIKNKENYIYKALKNQKKDSPKLVLVNNQYGLKLHRFGTSDHISSTNTTYSNNGNYKR